MNRAIVAHGVKPVIQATFPLDRTPDAFALMQRGSHFRKIAITL